MSFNDLDLPASGESSSKIAARVRAARDLQAARYNGIPGVRVNADAEGTVLEECAAPCDAGRNLIQKAAEQFNLSARGYHRILKVARTIADLEGTAQISRAHLAEALSYRLPATKS